MSRFTPSHKHKSGKCVGERGNANERQSRGYFLIKCITAMVRCSRLLYLDRCRCPQPFQPWSITELQMSPRLHTILLSPLFIYFPYSLTLCLRCPNKLFSLIYMCSTLLKCTWSSPPYPHTKFLSATTCVMRPQRLWHWRSLP